MKKLNKTPEAICQICAKKLLKFVYPHTMCRSCYYQKIMKSETVIDAFIRRIKTLKTSQSFYIKQNKKLKKALGKIKVKEILENGKLENGKRVAKNML